MNTVDDGVVGPEARARKDAHFKNAQPARGPAGVDVADLTFREAFETLLKLPSLMVPENRGIYTQSDSSKKSSRNIWSLAVVSVDQRY